MKLTTVLASVNNKSEYYMFIPKQILFWAKFNIKFIAIFIGKTLPNELTSYSDHIILWEKNPNLNSAFVAQNIRIYYPALISLPDDEMVMITDMDMLPMNDSYYKNGLDEYNIDDFIYYRNIDGDQIYMCYNAAHPKTWGKVFKISSMDDVENIIQTNYLKNYTGIPGSSGWFIDQQTMYANLIKYKDLKILNRPIKRIEIWTYNTHLNNGDTNFIKNYDDAHFHRNYFKNLKLILHAEKQL